MDMKTLLHNIHEEVSCPVCMSKFTDPKQLPCLHSFCLHCLEGIQRTSARQNEISCPVCRKIFTVPGGRNISVLPTNVRLNSLLDVLAIKESTTTRVKCGNCDIRSEQCYYCFQCCLFWCDNCISLHNGLRANKEHHALALKDFGDEDFESILKGPVFCQQNHHEQEELKFFCNDCQVAICNSCVATIHDGHAKVILEEVANERKVQMKSVVDTQKENVQKKINEIVQLDEQCARVQAQAATVKANAKKLVENIIAIAETNMLDINKAVDKQAKECLECFEKLKVQIREEIKAQKAAIEKTEALLKRSTSSGIVRLSNFSETDSENRHRLDHDLEGLRQFVCVENRILIDKATTEGFASFKTFFSKTNANQSSAHGKGINGATVGLEAQIVLTSRNAEGEQCYEERDCVTVEIRNRQGRDCATIEQVQDNKDGTYKISYYAKETGTCQTSVKVNGEHVHGSPFEVQVQTRQYKPVVSFGHFGSVIGRLNRPWGVAINERNEIAVTDTVNGRVQVFSSNGIYLTSFGKKGYQTGEFLYPSGIAFLNDNFIVADCDNHRVQVFTDRGVYLSEFGGKGHLDRHLQKPHGLFLASGAENVVVADRDNDSIKIFFPDGRFKRKIYRPGVFTQPLHCVQLGELLVVSAVNEHCIKVFDLEGNFLYKFGKKGDKEGELNEPRCLSVNKIGQLVICDAGNHRIQVFEPNGKFIAKFGSFGNAKGQFNRPFSAATLKDGRIVVSDIQSHRIQIFE